MMFLKLKCTYFYICITLQLYEKWILYIQGEGLVSWKNFQCVTQLPTSVRCDTRLLQSIPLWYKAAPIPQQRSMRSNMILMSVSWVRN